ncbi:MAG: hypothetical protein AAGE65_05875 [Planctomycetota bacterium]
MPLPPLTALNFAVITELVTGKKAGRDLREALRVKHGYRRSFPAFYQLMSRLEEQGFVRGEYFNVPIGDQEVRERRYAISGKGTDAWNETRAFYATQALDAGMAAEGV